MGTHNPCFEQKYENKQNILTENCHFYIRDISLYVQMLYGRVFVMDGIGTRATFAFLSLPLAK